jgi:hypothetical protein
MPIQRQSEAYGVFDDGPRFARDRSSTDLPSGLAGLVNSMGPRITGGLLNTRQAGTDSYPTPEHLWEGQGPDRDENGRPLRNSNPSEVEHFSDAARALRSAGYPSDGPRDHGGAGPDGGPSEPDWYYDDDNDDDGDPKDPPGTALEDPWGHRASRHPFDRTAGRRFLAFQWGERTYNPDVHSSYEQRLYSDVELHKAPLENGHELHAWAYRDEPDAAEGWNWAIVDPHNHKSRNYVDGYNDSLDNDTDWDVNPHFSGSPPPIASWLAGGGMHMNSMSTSAHRNLGESFDVAHSDHIPTLDDAKAQAQEHYQGMFPIGTNTGGHDSGLDYSDLNSYMRHLEGHRVALAPAPQDPAAMAPQVPVGGGFLPAHRVGLDWRDSTIPGTVIANDGQVHIRWDDGQYTSEDPTEVRLL